MLKFISTIFYIVFIAMIVAIAGLLIGTMLPIPGNIEMKIVKSGSMEPKIPTGSVVIVKPAAEYKFNDVITFGADTKTEIPTTHRVIGIHGEGAVTTYTTKGDANEEEDQTMVARRDVIGKVIFHLPYAGFVLDFARQPIGFTLLIAVPAGLVILQELLTIFGEARKWMRRRNDDDNESGTPAATRTLDLRDAPKIVYTRHRMMDEILVPMLEEVSESFQRRMHARYQGDASLARRRLAGHSWLVAWLRTDEYATSTALTICLVFASSLFAGVSGGTVAYFQDIEKSMNNVFGAGARWEEEAIAALEALKLEETTEAFALTTVPEEGSVLGTTDTEEPPAEEPPVEEPTDEPAPAEEAPPETPAEETETPVDEPQESREPSVEPPGEPVEPAESEEPESPQSPVNEAISEAPNEPQIDPPAEPLAE